MRVRRPTTGDSAPKPNTEPSATAEPLPPANAASFGAALAAAIAAAAFAAAALAAAFAAAPKVGFYTMHVRHSYQLGGRRQKSAFGVFTFIL